MGGGGRGRRPRGHRGPGAQLDSSPPFPSPDSHPSPSPSADGMGAGAAGVEGAARSPPHSLTTTDAIQNPVRVYIRTRPPPSGLRVVRGGAGGPAPPPYRPPVRPALSCPLVSCPPLAARMRTVVRKNGPNHLGLPSCGLSCAQTARVTSGCCSFCADHREVPSHPLRGEAGVRPSPLSLLAATAFAAKTLPLPCVSTASVC